MSMSRRDLIAGGAAAAALAGAGGAGAATPGVSHAATPVHNAGPNAGVDNGRKDGVKTSGARMIDIGGGHQVWVKQVGHGPIPVLLLHGGPGMSHFYFECFEEFLPADKFRFWYYDQLGCGFSDRPENVSLWTVDRYREEVETVRKALGLSNFVLFGHSWGGMLAMEYALKYQQHLSALVISNMTAGVAAYVKYANQLRAKLPAAVQAQMKSFEDKKDIKSEGYQKLMFEYLYAEHLCRTKPWPEPFDRTMKYMNATVYETMQGPDEFNIVGNYKNWDRWNDLHRITAKTLLLGGRHDTMSPDDIRRMGTLIPNSSVVICENGSHMSMYDDQQRHFAALLAFLGAQPHA